MAVKLNSCRRRKKSFTEALKEKYCDDDSCENFVVAFSKPRRKASDAELGYLQNVVWIIITISCQMLYYAPPLSIPLPLSYPHVIYLHSCQYSVRGWQLSREQRRGGGQGVGEQGGGGGGGVAGRKLPLSLPSSVHNVDFLCPACDTLHDIKALGNMPVTLDTGIWHTYVNITAIINLRCNESTFNTRLCEYIL
jgi:hypothetical protein